MSNSIGSKDYRNRVRGMLGAAKQRGIGIDDATRRKRAKKAMRSIVLEARLSLGPEQYQAHLGWLYSQLTIPGIGESTSIGQGLLYTNVPAKPADLDTEIRWTTARLSAAAATIRAHMQARDALAQAVLSGGVEEALTICEDIESRVGDSHWLVAMRLFILQRFRGIDAQKTYLATLRSHASRCISSAYIYLASVRNEPSVSMQWFFNDVRKRRFSRKRPEHRTYMLFSLLGEIPERASDISDIFRIEQAHSDVDLYETTVAVLQAIHKREFPPKIRSAIESCVTQLCRDVPDARTAKLLVLMGKAALERFGTLGYSDESPLMALSRQELQLNSHALSRLVAGDHAGAMWSILAQGLAESSIQPTMPDTLGSEICHLLGELCCRTTQFSRALADAEKIARNLTGVQIGPFLSELVAALREPTAIHLARRLSKCSLHTTSWGVLDRIHMRSQGIASLPESGPEVQLLADSATGMQLPADDDGSPIHLLSTVIQAGTSGHPDDAYTIIDRVLDSPKQVVRNWARVAALELYSRGADYGRSLGLLGHLEALNEIKGTLLPVEHSLIGLSKAHIKQHGSDISTPIAINALVRERSDDETHTLLRLAFNQFMRAAGLSLPSSITSSMMNGKATEYVYFLHEVCVAQVMDMSPAFSSSHELSVERRNICALLRTIDPARRQSYDEEIVSITHALSIWEGLKLVDGSRIHVDEDSLGAAARTELEGGFDRYASLVKAGVGVAEDFDVVLKSILHQEGYAEGLVIPQNEADELLATMVVRMKELFLSNTIFGLDGYVSKRIRHGSLVGHLRGAVERRKLITQRSAGDGMYEPNQHWLQRLTSADSEARLRLERALADFSRAFDRELHVLKDEKLQVRKKHSEGILDFTLSPAALHVIRSAIKGDLRIDALIQAAVVSFWTLLNPALKTAQELIRGRFQTRISEMFNRLQAAASSSIRLEPCYGEFVNAIRLAHEETQIQIATVSGWFEKSEVDDRNRIYSLDDAIDIGVESAKSAFPEFSPYIVKRCDSVLMPSHSLQLIADVMFIALGNIHMHAGQADDCALQIEARVDAAKEVITFVIRNSAAAASHTSEVETFLEQIRTKITNREFEPYVGGEGKSGLLKLAAMAYQSQLGNIAFGFEDDQFVLRMSMSFILHDSGETAEAP